MSLRAVLAPAKGHVSISKPISEQLLICFWLFCPSPEFRLRGQGRLCNIMFYIDKEPACVQMAAPTKPVAIPLQYIYLLLESLQSVQIAFVDESV